MLRIVAFGILASLAATPAWADEPFTRADRLGFSGGTPSGLNLEYSHEFGRRAVFLSGGYWGSELYGGQGGVSLERGGVERKHFSVNLVGGYLRLIDEDDLLTRLGYGGLEAYFRYRAFFIAPAVTYKSGKIEGLPANGVGFVGRLGFLWRI
jgi:hypothetical protein